MQLKDLKEHSPPTGEDIDLLFDGFPETSFEAPDDNWKKHFAKQIQEFPDAYVRCMDVFVATDPEYRIATNKMIAFISWWGSASGEDKLRLENGLDRIQSRIQVLTKRYLDEASAVREGLRLQHRGQGSSAKIRDFAQYLADNPPSAAVLAVLVFQPTEESIRTALGSFGKKAAAAKYAKDPKQEEKQRIFKCWQEWQKHRDYYKGKADFARQMIAECDHLTSTKKIEDWCRIWEKATITKPA